MAYDSTIRRTLCKEPYLLISLRDIHTGCIIHSCKLKKLIIKEVMLEKKFGLLDYDERDIGLFFHV